MKKIMFTLGLMMLLIILPNMSIYATPMIEHNVVSNSPIIPYAESRSYKYMTVDGIKYKRLWSNTGNYWVDAMWYPC